MGLQKEKVQVRAAWVNMFITTRQWNVASEWAHTFSTASMLCSSPADTHSRLYTHTRVLLQKTITFSLHELNCHVHLVWFFPRVWIHSTDSFHSHLFISLKMEEKVQLYIWL